ncbi:MAG TPA: response regulator [Candidatus Anoxymicrobiaceae bacterium]
MSGTMRPRVLVIEDEPLQADIIRRLLEKRFSAAVAVASNADEAREKLAEVYDLVTLDYQLPDCDGLSLLKEIAAIPAAPPVVMVTGRGDEIIAVDAFISGASGYVVKDERMPDQLWISIGKLLVEQSLA